MLIFKTFHYFSRLLRIASLFFATSQIFRSALLFSPLRSLKLPSSARKVAVFPISIFRALLLFSPLRSPKAPFSARTQLFSCALFSPPSSARKVAVFPISIFRALLLFSPPSSARKVGCGSEKQTSGLVCFSLSFVFGRFESLLSSGLQLRIKNQANLFYLRSPFTTFVPYK